MVILETTKEKVPNNDFTVMFVTWGILAVLILLYYVVLRQHVFQLVDTRVEVVIAVVLLIVTVGLLAVFLVAYGVSLITHQPAQFALKSLRLGLLAAALLALMVILSQLTAYTPKINGANAIAELRTIEVNQRTEWLLIRGQDRNKPVVLFLSGGPGGSQLATARYYFKALEAEYVVVTWEQPGAAKSLGAIDPKDITLDTYLDDGAAVAKYLCKEFNQPKIYIMGESWGSALGLMMIQQHPEYYYSFIGTGQMVDFLETERIDYQLALDDAHKIGDQAVVDKLVKQGPPPYSSGLALKTNAYLSHLYGTMARTGQLNSTPFSTMEGPFGVEYGLFDKINFFWGLLRTFDQFYGNLYSVDLRERCPEIAIPVYVFQGRYDFNAPKQLVEDYMSILQAPEKSLQYFEHSGHNPWQTENDLFIQRAIKVFQDTQQ